MGKRVLVDNAEAGTVAGESRFYVIVALDNGRRATVSKGRVKLWK